jgi:hypothetical protein
MTRETFDCILFQKGMHIIYKGRQYEIAAVDFLRREISFVNENGNEVRRSCKHVELT